MLKIHKKREMYSTLLVIWVSVYVIQCAPVKKNTPIPPVELFKFMKKFGYLEQGPADSEALYSEEAVTDAIKNVQKFGAIPQTGVLDNATLQLILTPRCGVPDIYRPSESRQKRFIIAAPGWKRRHITYFVANWSPKIGEAAVEKYIQLALDAWGQYARLKFRQIYDTSADIIVAFGRGPHGDGYPFDGPGNILAHAFFPYELGHLGGDIHFDDDENWKIKPSPYEDGVDFFTVAVHELGHSLGLGHSPVPDSIMFPYYRGHSTDFALSYDDILGMYKMYIQTHLEEDLETTTESSYNEVDTVEESSEDVHRTDTTTKLNKHSDEQTTVRPYDSSTSSTVTELTYAGDYETVDEHKEHEHTRSYPTTSTTQASIPDICEGSFDAVGVLRGELFVFKNEYVWRLLRRGIVESGYPVKFQQIFSFPQDIIQVDAIYERNNDGNIVLFTGNQYWVYNGDRFVDGSPRPLTDYGLPATLDKIDAVQIWDKNQKTYIYRNDSFWRYSETNRQMDPGYPRNITRWRGVPQNLDAAVTWTDRFTYFFKERLVWRFDNYFIKVHNSYPLPAPQTWLGCPEKPDTLFWLDS